MTLANYITLFRIFSVPLMIWLMLVDHWDLMAPLFILAGLSDAADGYIARRYGQNTELGAYLDPIADKLLLASTYLILAIAHKVPLWLVIAIITRDVLIIGGVLIAWLIERPLPLAPAFISKLTTLTQIVLAAAVLTASALEIEIGVIADVLVWIVTAFTGTSAIVYLRQWFGHLSPQSPQEFQSAEISHWLQNEGCKAQKSPVKWTAK